METGNHRNFLKGREVVILNVGTCRKPPVPG